ncbi:MAG: PGPGW domain-containing protein [Thermoleophilia bacterium]|nr:PGPGW domain-containing protein [Thermoleophilia bacterium]
MSANTSRRTRWMDRVRERKERHRERGRAYRVGFAAVGFGLIALGAALIPLPGPGWLVIALGLGMLALEFDRAERLMDRVLEKLERVTDEAAHASRGVQVALALAAVTLVAGVVAAAVMWELPLVPF